MPSKNEDTVDFGDGINLTYNIVVKSKGKPIVALQGNVPMPLFFDESCVNESEIQFKKIFEALVTEPVKMQMQGKIRQRQRQIDEENSSDSNLDSGDTAEDIFILDSKPEEKKSEPEEKKEDDQQQKDNSDNSSTEGEQGNSKQEHSDGEWESPGAVSG